MPDEHYVHPRLAAVYDVTCGWSEDRQFYLDLATGAVKTVLDLGCGTGLLTRAYAEKGCHVTGVDPAAAMLEVARGLPFGDKVEFVCADARDFRTDTRYDLIIMTGHAFQVFLEDRDVQALLATVKYHLAQNGRIVFETRNPEITWESCWNSEETLISEGEHYREVRQVISRRAKLIAFETRYIFADETLISKSLLRFHTVEDLLPLIADAGLRVHSLSGGWNQGPFDPDTSEEIVFVLEHAP